MPSGVFGGKYSKEYQASVVSAMRSEILGPSAQEFMSLCDTEEKFRGSSDSYKEQNASSIWGQNSYEARVRERSSDTRNALGQSSVSPVHLDASLPRLPSSWKLVFPTDIFGKGLEKEEEERMRS